jgi:hypothetical protein
MTTSRRSHRTECPQCGRRVTVRDDGVLVSHLVWKPSDSEQGWNVPRCPGGFIPPAVGDVVEVKPEPVNPPQPPIEESGRSVRAIRSGLPSTGRRR